MSRINESLINSIIRLRTSLQINFISNEYNFTGRRNNVVLVSQFISSIDVYPDPNSDFDLSDELSESEFDRLTTFLIDDDKSSFLNEQCHICLDDFNVKESITQLQCNHYYHKECIKEWLTKQSSKCPICRVCCKND